MSRILSEFLGIYNPSFLFNLSLLEKAAGEPAIDIKISTEIQQASKIKIRQMGLDPADTTSEELFESLRQRFLRDNKLVENSLLELDSKQSLNSLIYKNLKEIIGAKTTFCLKNSVVKRQLRLSPPKTLLKKLGYTSIDSILKKEPVTIILATAMAVESEQWKNQYYDLYKNLNPGDFEETPIKVLEPKATIRWQALAREISQSSNTTVISSRELGGVIILPLPENVDGLVMTSIIFALDAINELRIHSVFCKLQQVKDNFGEIIANASRGKTESLALIAGQDVPWHLIQKFYNRFQDKFPIELFEPHVQKEDIGLINIEETLSRVHPSLDFWMGTEYLAYKDKLDITSFNLKDVAINSINNLAYKDRCNSHFRDSLWIELMLRYISQSNLEQSILDQVDQKLIINDEPNEFDFNLMPAL